MEHNGPFFSFRSTLLIIIICRLHGLRDSSKDDMIQSAKEMIKNGMKVELLQKGTLGELQKRVSELAKLSTQYNFSKMQVQLMVMKQFMIWRDQFLLEFNGDDEKKEIEITNTCLDVTGWALSTMNRRIGLIDFVETYPRFMYCDVSFNELHVNKTKIERYF